MIDFLQKDNTAMKSAVTQSTYLSSTQPIDSDIPANFSDQTEQTIHFYSSELVQTCSEFLNSNWSSESIHPEQCTALYTAAGINMSALGLSVYRPPSFPDELLSVNMTNLIAYSVLFPMAAVGNLMVLNALFKSRRCKSRINLMILHLSLADMIVTFVFVPIEMTWHITIQWPFGEIGCKIHKFFSAFGFYTSSMILVCISLDRYFAVLHPLKVNDAQRRGKIMLFFAWVISAYISLPQVSIIV